MSEAKHQLEDDLTEALQILSEKDHPLEWFEVLGLSGSTEIPIWTRIATEIRHRCKDMKAAVEVAHGYDKATAKLKKSDTIKHVIIIPANKALKVIKVVEGLSVIAAPANSDTLDFTAPRPSDLIDDPLLSRKNGGMLFTDDNDVAEVIGGIRGVRHHRNIRAVTTAFITTKKNVHIGVSLCGRHDPFHGGIGEALALVRAWRTAALTSGGKWHSTFSQDDLNILEAELKKCAMAKSFHAKELARGLRTERIARHKNTIKAAIDEFGPYSENRVERGKAIQFAIGACMGPGAPDMGPSPFSEITAAREKHEKKGDIEEALGGIVDPHERKSMFIKEIFPVGTQVMVVVDAHTDFKETRGQLGEVTSIRGEGSATGGFMELDDQPYGVKFYKPVLCKDIPIEGGGTCDKIMDLVWYDEADLVDTSV